MPVTWTVQQGKPPNQKLVLASFHKLQGPVKYTRARGLCVHVVFAMARLLAITSCSSCSTPMLWRWNAPSDFKSGSNTSSMWRTLRRSRLRHRDGDLHSTTQHWVSLASRLQGRGSRSSTIAMTLSMSVSTAGESDENLCGYSRWGKRTSNNCTTFCRRLFTCSWYLTNVLARNVSADSDTMQQSHWVLFRRFGRRLYDSAHECRRWLTGEEHSSSSSVTCLFFMWLILAHRESGFVLRCWRNLRNSFTKPVLLCPSSLLVVLACTESNSAWGWQFDVVAESELSPI